MQEDEGFKQLVYVLFTGVMCFIFSSPYPRAPHWQPWFVHSHRTICQSESPKKTYTPMVAGGASQFFDASGCIVLTSLLLYMPLSILSELASHVQEWIVTSFWDQQSEFKYILCKFITKSTSLATLICSFTKNNMTESESPVKKPIHQWWPEALPIFWCQWMYCSNFTSFVHATINIIRISFIFPRVNIDIFLEPTKWVKIHSMSFYYQEHLIGNPDLFIHIEQYIRVRKPRKKPIHQWWPEALPIFWYVRVRKPRKITHTPMVARGAANFLMPVDVLF